MVDALKNLSLASLLTIKNKKVTAVTLPITDSKVDLEYNNDGSISDIKNGSTGESVSSLGQIEVDSSVYNSEDAE